MKVGKLNVDENGATSMRYNVRGIPTCCCSRAARWWSKRSAPVGKTDLQKMLDTYVATPAAS